MVVSRHSCFQTDGPSDAALIPSQFTDLITISVRLLYQTVIPVRCISMGQVRKYVKIIIREFKNSSGNFLFS